MTDKVLDLAPKDPRYQLPRLYGPAREPKRISHNPCKNLWNSCSIHWDGTVCSCFMDYSEQRALGSLQEQTLKQIWTSAGYRDLRKRFRKAWHHDPLCSTCCSGYEGGDVCRSANDRAVFFNGEKR